MLGRIVFKRLTHWKIARLPHAYHSGRQVGPPQNWAGRPVK